MHRKMCFRLVVLWSAFALVLFLGWSSPGAAWSAKARPHTGKLSSRLAQLANPAVRAMSQADQGKLLSVAPSGPGSILRHGEYLVVKVRVKDTSPSTVAAISGVGARILHVSNPYRTITVEIQPEALQALAALEEVEAVVEELEPQRSGQWKSRVGKRGALTVTCPGGSVVSEGDTQLNASTARTNFSIDGSGLSVGVLSDSFDTATGAVTHWAEDILSGDLPGAGNPCGFTTPVNLLQEYTGQGDDEGRAMAQIVHDLAPGAALLFASAFNGELSFADNIRSLHSAGAGIIVDDVYYYDEPFFQDGPVGVAVNDVTAAGALYFSSAGNQSYWLNGNNISGWEAPAFRPTSCPSLPYTYLDCMNFDPSGGVDNQFDMTLAGGGFTLVLQWNEPWYGIQTDLDVFVYSNGSLVASSTNDNLVDQEPFEYLKVSSLTGTVNVVIARYSGTATPRLKFMLSNAWGITAFNYPTSTGGDIVGPNIFGHTTANDMLSVAAVPYNNSSKVESYSAMGPATHYWGPVVDANPAKLLDEPQVLQKPDIAATDGGATTFFAQLVSDVWRFYGTSAAAPHAAAVAALMLDASPTATRSQVKSALMSTARAVGAVPSSMVGSGLIDADAAVTALLSTYSISGKVTSGGTGISGISVALSGASTASTTTGSDGTYEFTGLSNGDYVVTPSDSQYTFDPASSSVTVNGANIGDVNFTTIAQTGALKVTLSPAGAVTGGARWRVDGGDWMTSGATVQDLSAGSHTVSFKDVTNWTTPAEQTITVAGGQTTTAKGVYVQTLTADFSGTPVRGKGPLIVTFKDLSKGTVTSRLWSFGDGTTSTQRNPVHTYAKAGTYTVKLTVKGSGATATKTRTNYITVCAAPKAAFTAAPLTGTAPLRVVFNDNSTGCITSWLWNFGDGLQSTSPNPTHRYTRPGTYTVKLTVKGPYGTNTLIRNGYIKVK